MHKKVSKFDSPAWTRSEGKNPEGGLNAKGRASAKAEGHNLKPPVKSGDNPRRASFLSRMGNMPGPEHKPNGEPTRLLLSLNAWGASSKADAKKKAAAMSSVDKGLPSELRNPNRGLAQSDYTLHRVSANFWGGQASKGIAVRKIPVIQESGVDMRRKIASIKHDKRLGADHKWEAGKVLRRTPTQSSFKASGVGKSMEYSVVMNQSRFGGASAVGKAHIEKADKAHYADKLLSDVERLAREINTKAPERAYKKGIRHGLRHNAKVLVPLGAVGGSAVTAAGMSAHYHKKREPINVHVVKEEAPMYDQMGQPVQQKKRNPLSEMSGNAKLGTAGAAVGLVGAKRMAFAGTLPSTLKAQSDTAQNRVNFQERMATDQADRVRQATQIRNPLTRRRQVNMHSFYADKSAKALADAEGKKIAADNALKAAPAKRAAHLKSGGALVATGAAMGGLAAYNNAKERQAKKKVK